MPAPALPQLEVNVLFPATAGQFLELQPAWKSATCSPARNTGFAPSPTASAARRLISSISLRTHPTLEISIFWIAQDGEIEISSVGWVRKEIEEINCRAAEAVGDGAKPVFLAGEQVADFQAG